MELYNEAAALLINSNMDQLHGEYYSILDLDNINEMLQAPPADDSRFAPESINDLSSSHRQLPSLPPTIGPGNILGTEALNSFHNYPKLSCGRGGNFSSSGESEPAVSQGSSSTQADHYSSKRKLEDYQHSSTSDLLPPTSARGRGGGGFQICFDSWERRKKPRLTEEAEEEEEKKCYEPAPDMDMEQMKEMVYRAAAMRPVVKQQVEQLSAGADESTTKRKNVRISSDPQTVAARQRRERISDRLRILQGLVPGGSNMDTASMLHEAANYLTFLKSQLATCSFGNPTHLH